MESLFAEEEKQDKVIDLKIQLLSLYYPFKADEIRELKNHLNIGIKKRRNF